MLIVPFVQEFGDQLIVMIGTAVLLSLYGIYLLYSGRTQLKKRPITKSIIIWIGIGYGFCNFFVFFLIGDWALNTIIFAFVVLTITVQDLFWITYSRKKQA